MSVEEYAAKCSRLGRYAEYMVKESEIRASRFREGLNWKVKIYITSSCETYADILREAR